MPSPNAAQKTPAKKTVEKKAVDLGPKLARRRSQDFKSKIEGWENTAGQSAPDSDDVLVIVDEGDASPADVVVVVQEETVRKSSGKHEAEGIKTPTTPKSGAKAADKQTNQRKGSREVDIEKKAWVRRKSKPAVELPSEVKQATTPKKRVVSDGHWRRDRVKKDEPSPEKEEEVKEKEKQKEATPKPVTIRRSVVSVGLKVPPSVQDFVETEPARASRVSRRARSRERDVSREGTPDYESSGTKVYIKRRKGSGDRNGHGKGLSTTESSFTASSAADKTGSGTDITTPDLSPPKGSPPRPNTAPRERVKNRLSDDVQVRKRSADAEDVPRRVSRGKLQKQQDQPDRGRIPASNPAGPPKVFGNRIEGWLSEMPEDPFAPPSEPSVISDIRPRRMRHREADEDSDYEGARRRSSARTRRSRSSWEPSEAEQTPRTPHGWNSVDDWVDDSTPTGLRRSGARRVSQSPIKDRSTRAASAMLHDDTERPHIPRTTTRRYTYGNLKDRTNTDPRQRLPTIASDDTLHSRAIQRRDRLAAIEGSSLSLASDGDEPTVQGHGLKRRLTKHSDLMSILSEPREDGRHGPRRRSTRRGRGGKLTLADLMNEVSADELKYQRELRTLVDGVIPVLLTYVMSKSDAGKAPGSRKSSLHDNPALTQPIYDMGVSLERLKTNHKHIPMHDANELLLWAQSTAKTYADFCKAWRLGFEDIVVNLAPADESAGKERAAPWDDGLQRNKDGDLLGGDGERVDVAYLLKRPLLRVKNLSKTFNVISRLRPSALANDVTATYQELVAEARRRNNDERARLEDEAAADIDSTRARDPRNLVQLSGVNIDRSRSVRARDFFDMELYHSSGQQLSCKVELIRRDNPLSIKGPGDLLVCEVSPAGRWLLFPPILASNVSARKSNRVGEIVVMVRGFMAGGSEWQELMALQSTEDQGAEWVAILGSSPFPPKLTRSSSFNTVRLPSKGYERPSSPTESEVPFGERAKASAPRWDGSQVNSTAGIDTLRGTGPKRYSGIERPPMASHDQIGGSGNDVRSRYRHTRSQTEHFSAHSTSTSREYKVWQPPSGREYEDRTGEGTTSPQRPAMHRRTSSVPSQDMPTIPKLRRTSPSESTPARQMPVEDHSSAPPKIQKQSQSIETSKNSVSASQPSRPTSLGLRPAALPSFTPAFLKKHRRSSSPLKHEYEPSTASESSSDSDLSDVDDEQSMTSHSTVDEATSTLGELKDFGPNVHMRPVSSGARKSVQSLDQDTLRPSDSPSQAPYRGVPPSNSGSAKSVACLLSWNNTRGGWDSMHPEECEIVVTPGLVEAFDLAQAHAVATKIHEDDGPSPSAHGVKPLIALELTPLVPIRQGTALDISVTSPPTANSVLRGSNNVMFRSRNPEECAKLYTMINRARIDNPTWIALQNARGPQPTSNWGAVMDQRNAARADGSPSWMRSLSRKASTYRSKGPRSASIAASQSSIGTMNSVSSALRRFSGSSRFFNIAKSTIVSRDGTKSSGSDSLNSGAATPVPIDLGMGTPLGIPNTKCRLYNREDSQRWRDMGAARLTVMVPPRPDPTLPADPRTTGLTKRVLVTGKSQGETLLDVTLEERCFERVGRTGIAVTIWSELIGPNGELGRAAATGGVGTSQNRVFMIQMKSVSYTATPVMAHQADDTTPRNERQHTLSARLANFGIRDLRMCDDGLGLYFASHGVLHGLRRSLREHGRLALICSSLVTGPAPHIQFLHTHNCDSRMSNS